MGPVAERQDRVLPGVLLKPLQQHKGFNRLECSTVTEFNQSFLVILAWFVQVGSGQRSGESVMDLADRRIPTPYGAEV